MCVRCQSYSSIFSLLPWIRNPSLIMVNTLQETTSHWQITGETEVNGNTIFRDYALFTQ